jgi:UDP:flavonoid glycosyltransferase YjiC (YdhE family)
MGSAGDVFPYIPINRQLMERGHTVTYICNVEHEQWIRGAGFEFLPVDLAFSKVADGEELWKPLAGLRILMEAMFRVMPETYRMIEEKHVPGQTVLLAPFSSFSARFAQEKLGIPLVSIHLQPAMLRTSNVPMAGLPRVFSRLVTRLRNRLIDRLFLDPMLLPPLNRFRSGIGLPPIRRGFFDWVLSPQLGLGLFPDWFTAPQPDWPANTYLTGFPLFDRITELPQEVLDYLDEGEPPIVFTAGTAMRFASRFFAVAAEVCRNLNRRGMLLTSFSEQVPADLPAGVRHFRYASFTDLLPRAAALVHHGGIGTTAQAFAAGIPQLIVPFAFDQPENAVHMRQTGCGDWIASAKLSAPLATEKLRHLLTSAEVAANCRLYAAKIEQTDPITLACDRIESLMPASRGAALQPDAVLALEAV